MTPNEIAERVIALWERQEGCISGTAHRELAVALGDPETRLRTAQQIQSDHEKRA